jgi:hypothetical protein
MPCICGFTQVHPRSVTALCERHRAIPRRGAMRQSVCTKRLRSIARAQVHDLFSKRPSRFLSLPVVAAVREDTLGWLSIGCCRAAERTGGAVAREGGHALATLAGRLGLCHCGLSAKCRLAVREMRDIFSSSETTGFCLGRNPMKSRLGSVSRRFSVSVSRCLGDKRTSAYWKKAN